MSVPVYSGPDTYYFRTHTVNLWTRNPIYVAGFENGWVLMLIYYSNNNGDTRSLVGYIDYAELNNIFSDYILQFDYSKKRCKDFVFYYR